jgi:hypothetical protein
MTTLSARPLAGARHAREAGILDSGSRYGEPMSSLAAS